MTTTVVIGAGSGMGAAVAHRLAPRGRMVIADRDPEGLEKVAAALGGDVETVVCDVTKPETIEAVAARVDELGALVITAGMSAAQGVSGRTLFEINLLGSTRVLDIFDPLVGPSTRAVCFASAAGHQVPDLPELGVVLDEPLSPGFFDDLTAAGVDLEDGLGSYSWSKLGVIRMVRKYATPWGRRGARIMSLSPGIIETPMARSEAAANPIMEDLAKLTPAGRWAAADEVATVVEFLVVRRGVVHDRQRRARRRRHDGPVDGRVRRRWHRPDRQASCRAASFHFATKAVALTHRGLPDGVLQRERELDRRRDVAP